MGHRAGFRIAYSNKKSDIKSKKDIERKKCYKFFVKEKWRNKQKFYFLLTIKSMFATKDKYEIYLKLKKNYT